MDVNSKFIMECDFYGGLLTEKQREVVELYHGDNLSLAEIAEEFGISRQAVHDTLKNAENALSEYEEKLKVVEKFTATGRSIAEIDGIAEKIMDEKKDDRRLVSELKKIRRIAEDLDGYWSQE